MKYRDKQRFLEKEDLEKVKVLQVRLKEVTQTVAAVTVAYERQKQELLKMFDEEANLKKFLEKKYGDVSIDVSNGSIKANNVHDHPEVDMHDPSKGLDSGSGSGSGEGTNWGG
tara:strand:+ start:672 stop:1010 length:339 start_codon:yes stop_codon:yes gene_type:complete